MGEYDVKAVLDCARRLVEEGKPLHAVQLYHRVLAEVQGLDEPYVCLARIYHEWHRDAEAEGVLKQGILRSDDAERCAMVLAELYLERGAFEDVLLCLGPLRAKRHSSVHECFARALLHMGKLPEAEMEIRMALRVDHRMSEAREVLGDILLRRHRPVEAVAELRQAVRLNPYRGASHRLLGDALAQEHCWPEALEEFTLAVDMDPGDVRAWGSCGETLLRLRRYDEAETYFRRALALDRTCSDAEVGLGEIALQRGETDCALEAFDNALNMQPGHQRALDGKLRARVGVTRLAGQLLHVLLLVLLVAFSVKAQDGGNQTEAEGMFRRGVTLYDEGRFAEADSVFGRFLDQYPLSVQSSAATIMRAKALYVSGKNLESANVARGFLSTFPSSAYVADAHYLLGVIYRRIRRGEDAMRELLQAWETLPRPQPPRLLESLQSVADSVADQDVSVAFLRALLGTTPGRGPQAFLWLKMAEKGAAAEDIKAARLALDTLLSSYPEMAGHPRVSTLLGRIAERSDVKIAALLPLMRKSEMSAAKEIAADIADGIQYAVERFSLDTEQRVRVTLVQHDTERETQRAASGVRTLAADQKLVAILGPVFSNTTLAAARAAQEIGIPLISPTANANGIAAVGRCVFQANPDYEFRGKAMARYAVLTRGFRRLAVLAPSDSYGKFLAQGFLDEAKRLGALVIAAEWYERGSSDFKSQLGAIRLAGLRAASDPYIAFGGRKKLGELMKLVGLGVSVRVLDSLMACGALVQASKLVGPDAAPRLDSLGIRVVYNEIFLDSLDVPVQAIDGIYLPINSPEEIGSVSSQVVYFNIQAQLLGSGEWNNLSELDASRRYCAGMVFESDTYVDITNPSYAAWAAGFTTRYKRSPSKHVLFGYDTADLVLGVLREGATTREAITRALVRVKEYQGLHAKVGFSSGRVNVWVSILQFDGRGVIHVDDIQAE